MIRHSPPRRREGCIQMTCIFSHHPLNHAEEEGAQCEGVTPANPGWREVQARNRKTNPTECNLMLDRMGCCLGQGPSKIKTNKMKYAPTMQTRMGCWPGKLKHKIKEHRKDLISHAG